MDPTSHPYPRQEPFNPPSPDNVFTVRPRTSNSFRPVPNHPPRSSNTHASMNQAQLLGALSGTSYPPRQVITGLQFPHCLCRTSVVLTTIPLPLSPLSRRCANISNCPHPPTVGRGPPPPLRVLPSQTVSGPAAAAQSLPSTPGGSSKFGFPVQLWIPKNNQLLSILNRGSGQ